MLLAHGYNPLQVQALTEVKLSVSSVRVDGSLMDAGKRQDTLSPMHAIHTAFNVCTMRAATLAASPFEEGVQ